MARPESFSEEREILMREQWRPQMCPVDMDDIATWPSEVIAFLAAHSTELRVEREADRNYSLASSEFRTMNRAPLMPRSDEAKALIENVMADRELIAFHMTRLIDFNDVRKEGLLALNLPRHVVRLKEHLKIAGAIDELMEVDGAVTKMLEADTKFISREGAVWATPHRASLHDGGCDAFYESYGGEALERIASYSGGKLEQRLKQLGEPAVAVMRYPAYGWCSFTAFRLPQSMIELHLQHEGLWEATDCGWDIMIERDIPAKNIVNVLPLDDPAVAA
ncbi:hypothetical protein FGG78_15800 [Thioclava sp. BHET1]|nr:hypothetical protein FGG78_15800 [Thioclava sp. BHET1]